MKPLVRSRLQDCLGRCVPSPAQLLTAGDTHSRFSARRKFGRNFNDGKFGGSTVLHRAGTTNNLDSVDHIERKSSGEWCRLEHTIVHNLIVVFDGITNRAGHVATLINSITLAASEQETGISQVGTSMIELRDAADETDTMANHLAHLSTTIRDHSQSLAITATDLNSLVSGAITSRKRKSSPKTPSNRSDVDRSNVGSASNDSLKNDIAVLFENGKFEKVSPPPKKDAA